MNKILLGLAFCGFVGFATSCDSFLEENPKSEKGIKENFKSPSDAKSAVNGLYRKGFPEFFGNNGVYMPVSATLGGFISGFYDNEYKGQEVVCDYSQKLSITSENISGTLDTEWNNTYEAISRANNAIKYLPETPGLSDKERAQLLAESKFFRALNYFHLVRFFGDVPLVLEPYESLNDIYRERTPSSEVYNQIVKDLTEASADLPNEAFTSNAHRISQNTVETILAHVYLTMSGYPVQQNSYAAAATAARKVINNGKHKLIENGSTPETSAYNVIRTEDNNAEYIYTYESDATISSNARPQWSMPNESATWGIFKYSITNNAYRPIQEYLNIYDPAKDLRIQERQFFHSEYTYEKDGETIHKKFTSGVAPWIFYDEDALLNTGRSGKDYAIYRYAEVLLIAAEAIAQSEGVTSEAVKYLADVRSRAYTTTNRTEIESALQGLSKDDFVKEVLIERMRELPYEMRIWQDIQRTRLYPTTSSSAKGKVNFINVIGAKNPWGQTFKESHLLWPISKNEMQRNPSLVQNPGYE
ncbi:RagB/SusD family nutrient uptake outer membrane protein [Massilibacteroides vaginae]|uniref:RagB/SusD family nutrient uptake outer membrane protein n=1 Tax=Massilibacteroides vaginae TaxID=1673718 RepID=UPI000A1C8CE4|nr:RagB/SusD family nutrient uptake outer membrane protein [Massilibacteroides vaginae]